MKQVAILFIILILFVGCSGYLEIEEPTYTTLDELCLYVHNNIDYLRDVHSQEVVEYFQSPKESQELLTGDCEDYTIYFMYLAYKELDIKPALSVVRIEDIGFHAIAFYDGIYYDPTEMFIFEELPNSWHHVINWNYDLIMIYATEFYTKG